MVNNKWGQEDQIKAVITDAIMNIQKRKAKGGTFDYGYIVSLLVGLEKVILKVLEE